MFYFTYEVMELRHMQPKIGIISFVPPRSDRKNFVTPVDYIHGILDAGGMPIGIPVSEDLSRIGAYVELLDGLLVPGGEDVSPRLYGEDPIPQVVSANYEKDVFEYELIRMMSSAKKPIFGICRGHQVINTAFGGTLIQDIPSQTHSQVCHYQAGEQRSELTHSVHCQSGSVISSLLGDSCYVNSFHHQALRELADGFQPTAWAADGIVEAMENEDSSIWSVQWHPENLYRRYPVFQKLFARLIDLAQR